MAGQATSDAQNLGFLRVIELDGVGFLGGILVTNRQGRPLEFQCTTPIRPNRTQIILYGNTLAPFVCSELIGRTLYARLDVKPQLVVIDQEPLLELREHVPVPVAQLVDPAEAQGPLPDVTLLQCGRQHLRLHPEAPHDRDGLAALLAKLPADADLREPLERVSEALRETVRAAVA